MYIIIFILFFIKKSFKKKNSVDPDQMPRSAASDLGLYCLPKSQKRDVRLMWVKIVIAVITEECVIWLVELWFYISVNSISVKLSHCLINIWAATWQNQQCDCAPSKDSDEPEHLQSDQSLRCPHEESLGLNYTLSAQRRLIRLGRCPGWSASSPGPHSVCCFCHLTAHIYLTSSQTVGVMWTDISL